VGRLLKKQKIYLDTSAVSHLDAPDTPEKMAETLMFWDMLKENDYQIIISNITVAEITKCTEPKRSFLFEKLNELDYEIIEENDEALALAEKYLEYGVLKSKSMDDLRHISVATVTECKYIISWNFKHFVNVKVINKVQSVNKLLNYNEIMIIPPTMLMGGEEDE
jgi:hypothetical protein